MDLKIKFSFVYTDKQVPRRKAARRLVPVQTGCMGRGVPYYYRRRKKTQVKSNQSGQNESTAELNQPSQTESTAKLFPNSMCQVVVTLTHARLTARSRGVFAGWGACLAEQDPRRRATCQRTARVSAHCSAPPCPPHAGGNDANAFAPDGASQGGGASRRGCLPTSVLSRGSAA
jgi:hypothetical protein